MSSGGSEVAARVEALSPTGSSDTNSKLLDRRSTATIDRPRWHHLRLQFGQLPRLQSPLISPAGRTSLRLAPTLLK